MRRTSRWSVLCILSAILPCYILILILFSSPHGCSATARDTITEGSKLVDGQTLVSAGNIFELGFFSPPKRSKVKRYLGIWYRSSPQTIVWVANRANPLSDETGVLRIADGNLNLSDEKGIVYWNTGLELKLKPLRPVAKLNDTGNFVLLENRFRRSQNVSRWQSFDHPTDTFLFGMKMDENFPLTSWTSEDDPASGNFVLEEDEEGKNQLVVKEKSKIHWRQNRMQSDEIVQSDKMPSSIGNLLNFMGNSSFYENKRLVMNFTGDLQYWQLDSGTKKWSLLWREPKDICDVFNYCGNFGICNGNNMLKCKCLPGFKPQFQDKWREREFSDGCTKNYTTCGNDFYSLKRITMEITSTSYDARNETDCRQECLDNCQCWAYSVVSIQPSLQSQVQRGAIKCLTWTEELKNLRENQDGGYDLNIRYAKVHSNKDCDPCGTTLVPYPLGTGPNCGDPMYISFYCNSDIYQLSFMAPSGSYNVISINSEKQAFVIQMSAEEANGCHNFRSSSGNKILQLSQSSPFIATSRCSSNNNIPGNKFTTDSSLNGTVEVEIIWKPPLEPTCNISDDCKDWPNSICKITENGQQRCLCDTNFRWDGLALECRIAGSIELIGQPKPLPLNLILGVSLPITMAIFCAGLSIYLWRKKVLKRQGKQRKATLHRYDTEKGVKELIDSGHFEKKDGTGIDVPFYDFESILAATNNFSEENKLGKGGFGPVYKGKFPGGQEIAVKRLSSVSGQGLDEFKNEVVLIAKLQHRNLVRLVGYCIRGEEMILLYEYMPNKSLDSFIFDESFNRQLNWETRFNIILGVARGLLYLHHDSRLRIIHRDLKTSNILLDAEMNPKISDFGLARIIQGKQTEGNTLKVVGTYGYMAPEYALDGLFSIKSDVFSFGVVMLEIVSGKKSMSFYHVENVPSLIGYAWTSWQEGKALDLMDETLRSSFNESQVLRCVHVGLLCVQEDPSERPTMSNVVLLLGSENGSLPIPKQPAFFNRKTISTTASTSSKAEINTEISSTLEGR